MVSLLRAEPGKSKCRSCSFVMLHGRIHWQPCWAHEGETSNSTSTSDCIPGRSVTQDPPPRWLLTRSCSKWNCYNSFGWGYRNCIHFKIYAGESVLYIFVWEHKPVSIETNKQLDVSWSGWLQKYITPLSLVEDAEFRHFIQMLCPGYQIPSRKTLIV